MTVSFRQFLCFLMTAAILWYTPICIAVDAAPDQSNVADGSEGITKGRYATSPECGVTITDWVQIFYTMKGAFHMAKTGYQIAMKAATAPEPISKASLAVISASLFTSATGIVVSSMIESAIIACMLSHVKDPVRFATGSTTLMMKRVSSTTKNSNDTTYNRWEAAPAPYSDFITVCARSIFPYSYLASNGYCYKGGSIATNNDAYDGRNAYLCPEEWRANGFKRATNSDGTLTSDNKAIVDPASKWSNQEFIDYAKTTAPLDCRVLADKEKTYIHGYKYVARKSAGKICVTLYAFGDLPTASPRTIGCHYSTPPPPEPMCNASIPIKNSAGTITSYDDTTCLSCHISSWCGSQTNRITQAVVPMMAPVLHCIQETANLIMSGCLMPDGTRTGLMHYIRSRLNKIVQLVLALSIAFFALNIVMGLGNIKASEFAMFLGKVSISVSLIYGVNAQNLSGMEVLADWGYQLSHQIASIIGTNTLGNGLCQYDASDYIRTKNTTQPNGTVVTTTEDSSYIMDWDSSDCLLGFWLLTPIYTASNLNAANSTNLGLDLLLLPLAVLFSFWDVIGVLMLVFTIIMILMVNMWICMFMIAIIIGRMVLESVSYIFIACLPFKPVEHFFQGWWKEYRSLFFFHFTITGVKAFMDTLFTLAFFGKNTKFKPVKAKFAGQTYNYFNVDESNCFTPPIDPNNPDAILKQQCGCDMSTIGCKLHQVEFFTGNLFLGIKVTKVNSYYVTPGQIAVLAFTGFLLFRVARHMPSIAAELAGGARGLMTLSRNVQGPMDYLARARSFVKPKDKKVNKNNKQDGKKGPGGKGGGGDGGNSGGKTGSGDKSRRGGSSSDMLGGGA